MGNKKLIIVLAVVLIVAALLVGLFFVFSNGKPKDVALTLEELNNNGQFQLGKLDWGLSVSQVNALLPHDLVEDNFRKPPESSGYVFYNTEYEYALSGLCTPASVQFYNGTLETVQFTFHAGLDSKQWFDAQIREATRLFGEQNDKKENVTEMFESTIYTWTTEETMLQIALIVGDQVESTVGITVGANQQKG